MAVTLIIIVSAFVVFPAEVLANNSTINKIGVLAKRGHEQCLTQWTPTAEYLSERIPGYTFTIVPLDFEEINRAVEAGFVDFVLANSAIYVELESLYGVSRILTLKNKRYDGAYTIFGGVILLREDRVDINVLDDMAVREGIKAYANWPTIPQLYVKGEFVGGCDIISEMFQAGELQEHLKAKGIAVTKADA